MHMIPIWVGAAMIAALACPPAEAANLAELTKKKCAGCHQLSGPPDNTLATRHNRKGPPLYYAGNKFRHDWLEAWLQNPVRIRPAGDFPATPVIADKAGDRVDPAKLVKHPALGAVAAKDVSAYLMTLKPNDKLIAGRAYTPGGVSERMGAMDFVKFKGCGACHQDTPKYGGVSGPELYTAWRRLQPEFIVSYIKDPVAWEPRSLMPNKHLADDAIHKLANYLKVIGEKPEQSQ